MRDSGFPSSNDDWDPGNNDPTTQFSPVDSGSSYSQGNYWSNGEQQGAPNSQRRGSEETTFLPAGARPPGNDSGHQSGFQAPQPQPLQQHFQPQPQVQPQFTFEAAPDKGRPILPVVIIILTLVLVVLLSVAVFVYSTFKDSPITDSNSSSEESSSTAESTAETVTETATKTTSTSQTSSETERGKPPGERPTEAKLPSVAEPVNESARNDAQAGYLVNLYKSGPTSDEFANAVHQAYLFNFSTPPTKEHSIRVESPVTGKTYDMKCRDEGSYVHCSGGQGANVYIS